jgi:hypothetical protein
MPRNMKELDEAGPRGIRGGKDGHAEHTDREHGLVRAEIRQQPPVRLQRTFRHLELGALIRLATHREPLRY